MVLMHSSDLAIIFRSPLSVLKNKNMRNQFIIILGSTMYAAAAFSISPDGSKPAGMVLIHAKDRRFMIGMDTSDLYNGEPKGGRAYYVGRHPVSFTYDSYMDSTLVTLSDYVKLMGNNPSGKNTGDLRLSVEEVSWYDAVLYRHALQQSRMRI
jgi:hypothetical protein